MKTNKQLEENTCVHLFPIEGWDESNHLFGKLEALAVKAALASGRPLLVRGEPGTGKTQLARAVAQYFEWALVYKVINGLTELEDLFWHYDAVDRLGEAQVFARESHEQRLESLQHRRFLTPGKLWWAFDWHSAQEQWENWSRRKTGRPQWNAGHYPPGIVLLIDEIDKADMDLPNGLLEAFGQNSFQIPWLESGSISRCEIPLLVVITTNEERELPRAFLRRCLVLQLEYPKEDKVEEFINWMKQRGRIHFSEDSCEDSVLETAAELIRKDRLVNSYGAIRPGLAEFLDLIMTLTELYPGDQKGQENAIQEVSQFVLQKQGKVF